MTNSHTMTPPDEVTLSVARGTIGGDRFSVARIPGTRTLGITVVVPVGTTHEQQGEAGFAHLSEHLVHQGARDEHGCLIEERVLAVGGLSNAQTYPFHTEYSFVIPAPGWHDLPGWVDLARRRIAPSSIAVADVGRETAVIRQEVARRMTSSPVAGFPWIEALGTLSSDYGLRHNGFSDLTDLAQASVSDVEQFLDRTHRRCGYSVAIAGPWEPGDVMDAVGGVIGEGRPVPDALAGALDGPHHRQGTVPTLMAVDASVRLVPGSSSTGPEASTAAAMVAAQWADLVQPRTHWQLGLFGPTMGPDRNILIGSRPSTSGTAVPRFPSELADDTRPLLARAIANALDTVDKTLSSTGTLSALAARDITFGWDSLSLRRQIGQVSVRDVEGYLYRVAGTPAGTLRSTAEAAEAA